MPQVSVFYSSYKSLQVCLFVCFLRRWVGTRTLQPCPQSEKGTWRTKKIPSRSKLQSAPESGVISAWETNKGGENKAGAGLKRPSGQSWGSSRVAISSFPHGEISVTDTLLGHASPLCWWITAITTLSHTTIQDCFSLSLVWVENKKWKY